MALPFQSKFVWATTLFGDSCSGLHPPSSTKALRNPLTQPKEIGQEDLDCVFVECESRSFGFDQACQLTCFFSVRRFCLESKRVQSFLSLSKDVSFLGSCTLPPAFTWLNIGSSFLYFQTIEAEG